MAPVDQGGHPLVLRENGPPISTLNKTPPPANKANSTTCILDLSPKTNPDPRLQRSVSMNESGCSSTNNPSPAQIIDKRNVTNAKLIQIMEQKQKQVSPAFANHLLFPSDSPIKKRTKERIPLAVTSPAFQKYFEIKDQEKERKAEEVEIRKRKRAEIRDNKNKKTSKAKNSEQSAGRKLTKKKSRRQVIWTDSETESNEDEKSEKGQEKDDESSDSENLPLSKISVSKKKVSKGDYVIINYEGEYFPGVVENRDQEYFEISTMTFSTGNTFRWPEKPDLIWYSEKDIIESIDPPVLANKRGFYLVKEMTKFLTFTV